MNVDVAKKANNNNDMNNEVFLAWTFKVRVYGLWLGLGLFQGASLNMLLLAFDSGTVLDWDDSITKD